MEYGSVTGIKKPVSRLVLGTMIISVRELQKSFNFLDAAFEHGCTTFDTARRYHGGESELGIGQWMKHRGNRDKVVIISKGCHPLEGRTRVTPEDLTADLNESLTQLQTDYIDIYLLHRDDPTCPVGPIVEILNEHLHMGRIHAFGGSNWAHQRIGEANEYAEKHGLTPFVVSSPSYSLANQVKEPWGPGCVSINGPVNREARAWYEANQMPLFAYSSLGRGFFSGRITPNNFEKIKSTLDPVCLTGYCHEENFQRLDRVMVLAEEKKATIPQIAIAYILASPLNVFPISGAANKEELEKTLKAFEVTLSEKERAWLNLEIEHR